MADARIRADRSVAPWIVSAVAAAVLVALLVVYFVVFLPYRRDHPLGGLTGGELDAMAAATVEMNNVGALAGKGENFEKVYAQAEAGAAGKFKKDLLAERSQAKSALSGKGVTEQVTHRALVGPAGSGYVLLMTLAGPRTSVTSLLLAPQQVLVTVVHQGGTWLVSDVQSAGVSQ
jgi:hypothetical protein